MSDPVITSYPDAPLPTKKTLRRRQNLLIQFGRFVVGSVNIMMMVVTGHKEN